MVAGIRKAFAERKTGDELQVRDLPPDVDFSATANSDIFVDSAEGQLHAFEAKDDKEARREFDALTGQALRSANTSSSG
jgi:hypothetical protein